MSGPVEYIPAKTIVQRTRDASWFGAQYNINIYRGCSHGCIYCDSRSDCYRNDRFDQVRVKADALRIIRDDLARKAKPGVAATGSMSDPYNPLERDLLLTRRALTLLEAYGFGAAIATKSDLITRDIDILTSIGRTMPVICKLTITTCDDGLAAKAEPRAPSPSRRLAERYRRRYGSRYYCPSPRARELWDLFRDECGRRGVLYDMGRIIAASRRSCENGQLSLF